MPFVCFTSSEWEESGDFTIIACIQEALDNAVSKTAILVQRTLRDRPSERQETWILSLAVLGTADERPRSLWYALAFYRQVGTFMGYHEAAIVSTDTVSEKYGILCFSRAILTLSPKQARTATLPSNKQTAFAQTRQYQLSVLHGPCALSFPC